MIWHTGLRAMKAVVAGAVGAICGEANLTHRGPRPPWAQWQWLPGGSEDRVTCSPNPQLMPRSIKFEPYFTQHTALYPLHCALCPRHTLQTLHHAPCTHQLADVDAWVGSAASWVLQRDGRDGGRGGSRTQNDSEAGYGRPVDRGAWAAKTVKRPRQQPAHPQYANYWAPLTRKRHTMPHPAQPQHTKYWALRTRKRHQQEHQPQRPTESSDPTQHAKGRTGDCLGPRKGAITRRNVTQGGGGGALGSSRDKMFGDGGFVPSTRPSTTGGPEPRALSQQVVHSDNAHVPAVLHVDQRPQGLL